MFIRHVPLSSASLLSCALLFRHELGIIAAVEEDHAVQFVALHHGPTPALRRFHLACRVLLQSELESRLGLS